MLSISDLAISFKTRRGDVDAVRGISFELGASEILGIVGESGSGKSVTAYSLMRILDEGGVIKAGELTYSGVDLRRAKEHDMRDICRSALPCLSLRIIRWYVPTDRMCYRLGVQS